MNRKHLLPFLLLLLVLAAFRPAAPGGVQLARLRCELLTNPEGIDATAPRLSWELSSPARPHPNRLLGAGSLAPQQAGRRRKRPLELGQGGLGPIGARGLRRSAAPQPRPLLL